MNTTYDHTQKAPLSALLLLIAVSIFLGAWICPDIVVEIILDLGAISVVFFAFCFHQLTVRDEGENLAIRYGPLPVFRKKIAYSTIRSAKTGRSSLIDGWGIHYIPWRGWTYNLWGFDCVELDVDGKTIRIGTDDVKRLEEFLGRKVG